METRGILSQALFGAEAAWFYRVVGVGGLVLHGSFGPLQMCSITGTNNHFLFESRDLLCGLKDALRRYSARVRDVIVKSDVTDVFDFTFLFL